ncbi:MAG: ATP-binding protein [Clostridiales bacterium]|nr:ATP-binding protein [Clostridiales bacterium]
MAIIGRKKEQGILKGCLESGKSEFVAIYGRRRVGKTFLVKEFFEAGFAFYSTGILNGNREAQLQVWNNEILRFGGADIPAAQNWVSAFDNLNLLIEKLCAEQKNPTKKVIFLDEIPWMATLHSDFIAGLDYFWNRWASSRKDVLLIVCGSAASWITDKIINDKGGLHNRITRQILVEPFTLKECEVFFESRHIPMTHYQMAEAYMIFGGIPYYLSLMEPRYSLYQNVDEMYFAQGAELHNEFENLYRSLYRNADHYIRVVEALAKKGIGLSRTEIAAGSKIADGGTLTKILRDLSISGFIREYRAYGQKKRDSLYQLTDFFSMFDIRFRDKRDEHSNDYWLRFSATSAHSVWSGLCYEKLCLSHLPQIRKKLGIAGVLTAVFSWRGKHGDAGAQVDLIIDRSDNIINLCEIKFSSGQFQIDKKHYESMRNKKSAFANSTRTRKAVQTTMITTFGLKQNAYSAEIVSEVLLDDLFE